ncbi:hypothetical protein [Microseira wollei]|nr:hypothetical protein [Microseira wollei]
MLQRCSQSRKLIPSMYYMEKVVKLTVYYMETLMLKRDIQAKFAVKNDDYRQVRCLRLYE